MSHTKDEKFLIRLYELTKASGVEDHLMDPYDVGRSIHFSPILVETLCKTLRRTNFIRYESNGLIYLTSNGIALAEELLQE